MKSAMVHVEVLDGSMNVEYIVAVPADFARIMFWWSEGTYWTREPIDYVLSVPGSFIVCRRNFSNEKIGMK